MAREPIYDIKYKKPITKYSEDNITIDFVNRIVDYQLINIRESNVDEDHYGLRIHKTNEGGLITSTLIIPWHNVEYYEVFH